VSTVQLSSQATEAPPARATVADTLRIGGEEELLSADLMAVALEDCRRGR
jgi:hypothetical protein